MFYVEIEYTFRCLHDRPPCRRNRVAIKVLIERRVKAGHEETVWAMLRDLRSQAVRMRGCLYGETWRSLEDPRVFVAVSVWGGRVYWEHWLNDEFRRRMDERINLMLRRPSTARIFEEVTTLPTPIRETERVRRKSSRSSNRR